MTDSGLRLAILGTGALATFFGARLGARETASRSAAPGARAWTPCGSPAPGSRARSPVPLHAVPVESLTSPAELVLVLVKATQTAGVAGIAARLAQRMAA